MERQAKSLEFKSKIDPKSRSIIRSGKEIGYIAFPQGEEPKITLFASEGFITLTQTEFESVLEITNSEVEAIKAAKQRNSFI